MGKMKDLVTELGEYGAKKYLKRLKKQLKTKNED